MLYSASDKSALKRIVRRCNQAGAWVTGKEPGIVEFFYLE